MTCVTLLLAAAACGSPPTGPGAPAPLSASPVVSEVVVKPQAVGLGLENSANVTATAYDAEGNALPNVKVSWTVADSTVVSYSNGTATGTAEGSTTILASAGGKSDKTSVHVQKGANAITLTLSPRQDTLAAGDSVQIVATVTDGSGDPVNATVNWSSSDPSVATVESGMVRSLATGTAAITAKVKNVTADAEISVVKSSTKSPDPPVSGASSGTLAAFPGAEGYGATALSQCNRSNLQVLHVTNLQDSGTGSLRDAISRVDNSAFTVIVFNVAGYIHLTSDIEINNDECLYIAGQTAPGGGITIQRAPGKGFWLKGATRDVVIRYLRFRAGYTDTRSGNIDILVGSGNRVILDHLSLSWANDKLLAITKYDYSWSPIVTNITVQRSILSEILAAQPTAVQISAQDKTNAPIDNIDMHHDLFANNDHRNPNGVTSGLKVVNNVIYNWNQGAGQGAHKAITDWIKNYYKAGPATQYPYEITFMTNSFDPAPSFYVIGNVGPHNSDPYAGLDAQWSGPSRVVACYYNCSGYGDQTPGQPLPDSARRDTPLPPPPIPIRAQLATDAYKSVLADVGANARLACNGDWVSNIDPVDKRIISETANNTGPASYPATPEEVGGFPSINPGTPCVDTDRDGMPDAFEIRYGLDPKNAADAALDSNKDGYTNLEEFLNGRNPL